MCGSASQYLTHPSGPKVRAQYSSNVCALQVDTIIRVDHAGELGADRIYAGQLAVLKNTDVGPVVQV